jgi:hypothetical protein
MNKINKIATIVLALVVSVVTNAEGFDKTLVAGKYTEKTGGKAEIKIAKDQQTLRFALLNGTTPGEWKCKIEGETFIFLEGPFKDQVYLVDIAGKGEVFLHQEGGRQTVWMHE